MSATTASVHSRFSGLLGAASLLAESSKFADYEIGGMKPAVVVRPESVEQIPEIIKLAAAEKLAVITTGGRSKLNLGLPPERYDLALDMSALNKIISYDPGDLTLSVEAGIPLLHLAKALGQHGQFLPFAVPFTARTTIGGIIASGVDGPLRQFYGTARDYLLGMEFVTGDGIASKSGGRVVKNVTGYDIHKLMIGALGSLGVITRLNFKTFPLPVSTRGLVARFVSAAQACAMRDRIAKSPLTPITLEVLSPRVGELFAGPVAPSPFEPAPMPAGVLSNSEWTVTTGYCGNEKVLARYAADLRQIAEECGTTGVMILAENLGPAWARKREFIPIALASSPATTIVKISVLPARMENALDAAQAAADANSLPWAALARGVGIIYFALLPEAQNEHAGARVLKTTRAIHEAVAKLEGSSTIPWCPAEWKPNLQIWGLDPQNVSQMQKLKNVFDPQRILSPGRFVGGL
ncbi:MAG TPA: FAD-binding oxidoreductase [Candidatus Acidoferrales bacterium]